MTESSAFTRTFIRPLYDWTFRLAAHPQAKWALFLVAFAESSFFPIPPDVLLIPLVLARPAEAWRLALICLAGSVSGGIVGYALGFFLYTTIGVPILSFYGYENGMAALAAAYDVYGGWMVLASAFSPIPYKVFTIASGAMQYDVLNFILFSIIGRGARFILIAGLLYKIGPPIRDFIEKRLGFMTLLAIILLIGGFLLIGMVR